jgi:hypothetical protein
MNLSLVGSAIKRLNVWEEQFKSWFDNIKLLGEIPLSASELEEICQDLRTAGSERVRRAVWPHTLVICMAAVAARNDERRYWGVLTESFGLPNSQQIHSKLGDLFHRYLHMYGLPTFQSVGGYRHVTPIRLHGGIPAYSLPDFFREVVLLAIHHPDYIGLSADELIPLALQRSVVQLFVDSPVRYFLEHGGEAAENFLDRCLEMARRWEAREHILSTHDLGLPRYVVDAFEAFMEGQAQTPQGRRLRSPRLFLTPSESDTLYNLELPDEPVDAEQADWRYAWRIEAIQLAGTDSLADDDVLYERVKVRRSGHDLIAAGRTMPIFFAPAQIHILFEGMPPDGEAKILGQWRLNLVPVGGQPILGFRSDDGSPLRSSQFLPADTIIILYPSHTRLEATGNAHCVQSFPQLLGEWSGWQIEEWDLRDARGLWITNDQGERLGQPLSIRQIEDEARLVGGSRLNGVRDAENTPLYVGAIPNLWLPRLTGESDEKELAYWHVILSPKWVTYSKLRDMREWDLVDWPGKIETDSTGFTVSLVDILGEDALGAFSIEIRGPRSFQQDLRLRLWFEVSLVGLAPYYLPGQTGADAASFRIRVSKNHQVRTLVGESETLVEPTDEEGYFEVTVSPVATEAVLELVAPQARGEAVRLGIHISIPRLRWLLRLDDRETEWRTTHSSVPAARLLQSNRRELIIDWAGVPNPPTCLFLLSDATVDPPKELQKNPSSQQGNHQRILLNLTAFHDTLQHYADVPIITLFLRLGYSESASVVPLLYLTRSLDVSEVILEWDNEGRTFLHWEAKHRLRNRRVRLWSVWRPWEAAREFVIPDDAPNSPVADGAGSGFMNLPESLPIGWYQVSLRTAHGWEPLVAPPLPTDDALLSREGDWELRILELDDAVHTDSFRAFYARWEWACIFDSVDDYLARDEQIEWLSRHLEYAKPRELIALRRWMTTVDPINAKVLRFQMYTLQQLQRLFKEEDEADVLNDYLDELPNMLQKIAPETAQLMLESVQRPDMVNYALNILLEHNIRSVVNYLLTQIENGAYSDRDAVNLLRKRADQSLHVLSVIQTSPGRDRLLLDLATHVKNSGIVRPGDWIRSEAGWGKITSIFRDETEIVFCFADDDVRFFVTLRDGDEHEPIEIDTMHKTIHFLQANQVYQCCKTDCPGFRSYSERLLREKHNRSAHLGVGPAFEIRPASSSYSRALLFSKHPPENYYT